MKTTFANLVNRVAVRLNEPVIKEDQFQTCIGIHSMMKEAVLESIREIIHASSTWPFLAVQQTQSLDDGTSEYAWPLDFDTVDWDSFLILKDVGNNTLTRKLTPVVREEWYSKARSDDIDSNPDGRKMPSVVFSSHGNGFGVSPSPDKRYKVQYRYFKYPILPSKWADESPVPSKYDNVVIAGAMKHMYSFLDNTDRSTFWRNEFQKVFSDMIRIELNNNIKYVYSGQLHGRSRFNSIGW